VVYSPEVTARGLFKQLLSIFAAMFRASFTPLGKERQMIHSLIFRNQPGGSTFAGLRRFIRLSTLLLLLPGLLHGSEVAALSRHQPAKQQAQHSPQKSPALELFKPIERELAGEQRQGYQVTLAEGQCANVIIEQRGIDVVVQLLGTDGKLVAEVNDEIKIQGEEKIELLAETAGTYSLLIRATYPKLAAGRFEIRLTDVRNAAERDRWLYEARKQYTASRQLLSAGKYAEAVPPGEKAIELREQSLGAEHPDLILMLAHLAAVYYSRGNFAKHQALCQRGLAIAEKTLGPEHWKVALMLYNLALFHVNGDSDFARAESLFQRALAIQEKALGAEHPLTASTVADLGTIYRIKGELARAEPLFQRALMALEKALGEEHSYVTNALAKLAALYREMGDYAKAEPLNQRVAAIWERLNHPMLALALNNLANVYRDAGDYDKAEPLYERAIAIKEKIAPGHQDTAIFRLSLGLLYHRRGDYAKAAPLYLSALATFEKALGPNHQRVGEVLGLLAELYVINGDYAKAEPLFQRVTALFEAAWGADYFNLAGVFVYRARMAAAQGKIAEAVAFQTRANAIIEYNLALNLAIGSERQKLAYLTKLPEQMNQAIGLHVRFAAEDLAARELAATAVLQHKGRVQEALSDGLASLRRRFSAEDQALLDRLNGVTSELARLALNGPRGLSLAEHRKKLKPLEEQRDTLESEISRRSAGFYARSQPATLAAIQSAIPDDAALIEIAVYRPADVIANQAKTDDKPRYIAYVMRKQGEVRWRELGGAMEIDKEIDELRKALRDPRRRDAQQLARTLDQKIMQPLRPLLGDATQLLISPDGALSLIPFEILVDEQNGYLVERFSCTYLTSGRDLLRLQVARQSKSSPVIFANPLFGEPELLVTAKTRIPKLRGIGVDSRAGKRQSETSGADLSNIYFAPLGGTHLEAQAIKSLFAEAAIWTGTQATESLLKKVAAPRIMHIATHGFFLTDTPQASDTGAEKTRAINTGVKIENPLLRSGLALAGANLNKNSGDDGILTALEATSLNLWGTKLVTLSACDTGVGEVKNGEGIYGLRRAFVLAGSETLVMSLWPVSDYVTRELMTAYYKGLKQGQGRGEALRQVQLAMLKRKGREHPFFWASFIQAGEWANLNGKR
jgi:CHAT domain-containing protein/lipopolysaccharide biosynthesis regulator YciM